MPYPANYDGSGTTISVNASDLYQWSMQVMPNYGKEIADSVNRIVKTWNDLKIGWVGNTADEAQDFNDRWAASISELFGTDAEPAAGILSRIANGITMASVNYDAVEDVVTNMFKQTSSALFNPPDTSNTTPDSHRATNNGPITENN
jgi:hypothetical protein